jgi:GGDEF domain-containing protein
MTETSQTWFIRIPRMNVTLVSLFSRDSQGNWQAQSAGESIARSKWALRTRVPSFELQTSASQARTYYLRFEHRIAITERPMLLSPIEYVEASSRMGIMVGLLGGMFGLLSAMSLGAYVINRNTVFLWFGAFVVALMVSQATLIGYSGWQLWPESAHLNQVMGWVSSCLTLAAGAWFCAVASYSKDSQNRIYQLLRALAVVSLLLALLAAARLDPLTREMRNAWAGLVTVLVIGSLGWMALRGRRWNAVLLVGLLPIGAASLARLAYNLGWASHIEVAQTASIFSTILGLLWLMLALVWRSRVSLLSKELASALNNYDPATGLIQERVAHTRMPQMLLRASTLKLGCGVIMLRWINYQQLMSTQAPEKQAAMLKQVGLVFNRVARDIDTAARLSDGYFLILVEGPVSRSTLSSLSTQILTSCIRLSDKFKLPQAFDFHIAIWQAQLVPVSDKEVMEMLKARLNQMSFGTKRPVQFVDIVTSDLGVAQKDEVNQRRDDLIAKIDAIEASPDLESVLADKSDK